MWDRYASLLPHLCQPAASTANYGAVQATVSDFPKNAGRCPKKLGETIPQLRHVSRAREQRAPDAARTWQSRCMKSSLMRATVPASVGFQLNDFFKKIIQLLLKALTR